MTNRAHIAIGLPSFNEAHNISQLTRQIDQELAQRGLTGQTIIINSDNTSPDGTADVFAATQTRTHKLSLLNHEPGKGSNLRRIFQTALQLGVDRIILIDSDIRSFDGSWLDSHLRELADGYDFVLPVYARNMFEGNSTNHLISPLVRSLLGVHIKQPLAGDCSLSGGFAAHLVSQDWSEAVRHYGIETFMILNACLHEFAIAEVVLDKKIHNPSFDKMTRIYEQVAVAAFETLGRYDLGRSRARRTRLVTEADIRFLEAAPPPREALYARQSEAIRALDEFLDADFALPGITAPWLQEMSEQDLDAEAWAEVLSQFCLSAARGGHPQVLMNALKPLFLLRSSDFIEQHRYDPPEAAVADLLRLHQLLASKLGDQQYTLQSDPA